MAGIRRRLQWGIAALLPAVCVLAAPAQAAVPFFDDFESYSTASSWRDGRSYGRWTAVYNGYGTTAIQVHGSKSLSLSPRAARSPGETSAGLVVSTASFNDVHVRLRARTAGQLRTGSAPNPWEVGWVIWSYQGGERFYYFIAKPNGFELGQSNNAKLDQHGPTCTWPSYQNCRFPGAQRFLRTGSQPRFPVGAWNTVEIRQVRSTITVWVNGAQVTSYTDALSPLHFGKVGLYAEDAHVYFDDVTVHAASAGRNRGKLAVAN
jgi:hypothetical protein